LVKLPFVPKERKFFNLFEEAGANAVRTAKTLKETLDDWENMEAKTYQIEELEHTGDTITHRIIEELHRTFVTPFDREDIASLAHSLDDVVDFVHAAAMAMLIYKVDKPTRRAKELVDIIVQAATEIGTVLPVLRSNTKLKMVLDHCVEINRLENIADKIYRAAMGELFEGTMDVADIIKWREIYEHMESATDRCEDVANVLEGIALKHA
jgi:predicted phosphate transport protein (TIGR00153 family)